MRIIAIVITIALMKKSPLKPLDIPVIIFALALTFLFGWKVYNRGTASSRVIVKSPEKTWIFPLEANELLSVKGSMGETLVEIHDGRAAIVSSPCGGQICVAAGKLHKNGQWASCLPNRVFFLIEGAEDEIDAASW